MIKKFLNLLFGNKSDEMGLKIAFTSVMALLVIPFIYAVITDIGLCNIIKLLIYFAVVYFICNFIINIITMDDYL